LGDWVAAVGAHVSAEFIGFGESVWDGARGLSENGPVDALSADGEADVGSADEIVE
jgi:hypothetical protein